MSACGMLSNFCEPSPTHPACTCVLERGHEGEHTNGRIFWNVGRAPITDREVGSPDPKETP